MEYRNIRVLDEIVARQIAAGEVIDKPAAVLRELIDNAIDAEATQISVIIKESGLGLIQVSDNGIGIQKDDLPLAFKPHATSKITTSNDLQHILSMGFRGEALPSIASVARVSLVSKNKDLQEDAWRVEASHTSISAPQKAARDIGTTVSVEQLFQDIPARRKFLSSPNAELAQLKTIFIRKAVAFPHISFSFQHENQSAVSFSKETPFARSIRIFSNQSVEQDFIWIDTTTNKDSSLSMCAAIGVPSTAQRTRRNIFVYINNRQVKEFSLIQAIEYSYSQVLHKGSYPQAVVFLSIPPEKIDVNIHPAKSEVKIRGIEEVRSLIISTIKSYLSQYISRPPSFTQQSLEPNTTFKHSVSYIENNNILQRKDSTFSQSSSYHSTNHSTKKAHAPYAVHQSSKSPQTILEHTKTLSQTYANSRSPSMASESYTSAIISSNTQEWRFIDMLFTTYLLFERQSSTKEGELLILDFHATHERILFDFISQNQASLALLVPIPISLHVDQESIQLLIEKYKAMGILIEQTSHASQKNTKNTTSNTTTNTTANNDPNHEQIDYELKEIPAQSPIDAEIIATLIETLPIEEINAKIFASRACRTAAKAGDHVDIQGATRLLEQAFALDTPRCPHGRPLWISITKHTLDSMIGRV